MALKSVLESVDDLPEDIKKEYVQRGDVWVLDIEDFGKHPGAVKLKTTLDKLDGDKKTIGKEFADYKASLSFLPDGFDEDAFKALSSGKTPNADVEAIKIQHKAAVDALKTQHKAELDAANGTISNLTSSIENNRIEGDLKDALLEVGVDPDLLEGALLTVRPLAKVTKDTDGSVTGVVIDTELGETAVAEFAKEWAGTKGKAYLGVAKGPGADGNRNPGRKGPTGDFGGDRTARTQAIASKFPELAGNR